MAANEAPVLVSRDVWKRYALGALQVEALKGVSITVMREEFLALAGSSGSGKTTLLNLFGCLDLPTEGEILVEGTDTRTLDEDQAAYFRSAKIGFIFQTFNLIPVLTALENVEYPLLIQGRAPGGRSTSKEREERARAALTKVGLDKVAHHRPDQLSGGQRQRVAIARALVKDPTIILADEPTANLDKRTAIEILDLMRELNERERVTFVFSSHDSLLLSRAKRIFYISDGKEVSAAESGAHHHD